jgi:hypothetical protein
MYNDFILMASIIGTFFFAVSSIVVIVKLKININIKLIECTRDVTFNKKI